MDNQTKLKIEELRYQDFSIEIGRVYSDTWRLFLGTALYSILAIFIPTIIFFLILMWKELFFDDIPSIDEIPFIIDLTNLIKIIASISLIPIPVSIFTIAKKYDRGEKLKFSDLFVHYRNGKFSYIVITILILLLFTLIGFIFCLIPGVLFGMSSIFAIPFVIFADSKPMESIRASFNVLFNGFEKTIMLFLLPIGIILLKILISFAGLNALLIDDFIFFFILLPIIFIGIYVFYKNVIGFEEEILEKFKETE